MAQNPYGLNETKRLTIPQAEELLYEERAMGESEQASLVDYMGGDAMVTRVATQGFGPDIFPEKPSAGSLLPHLKARGVYEPFKSVQFKFHIQCDFESSLHIIYDPRASVNVYSGRYSELPESMRRPSAQELAARSGSSLEDAIEAAELIAQGHQEDFQVYKALISKDINLARELARAPVGLYNDTKLFWKMDLVSLVSFIKEKRALLPSKDHPLHQYLDYFEEVARATAPVGTATLLEEKPWTPIKLTWPRDEDIIDPPLQESTWGASTTRRVCVPELEEALFQRHALLDHGEIQAIDYMGSDRGPVEAARMSYGKGTRRVQEDPHLLKYLYRHKHTTPFEMIELAIEGKLPIFTDPWQAGRHRTLDKHGFMGHFLIGSQYFKPDPTQMKEQSKWNRQGRGAQLSDDLKERVETLFDERFQSQQARADKLRELGMTQEIARAVKGMGFYTKIWRTGDMHNWCHFLRLRLDAHAQKEIRDYAQAVEELVQLQSPNTHQALQNYSINAVNLTAADQRALQALLRDDIDIDDKTIYRGAGMTRETKKKKKEVLTREGKEFKSKLEKLLPDKAPEECGGGLLCRIAHALRLKKK